MKGLANYEQRFEGCGIRGGNEESLRASDR